MKKGYLVILVILAILTSLSLALNGVVIFALLRGRQIALDAVSDARAMVTDVGEDTFSYTFTVQQEIPISTSIPFAENVTVPIHTTIPISTTVIIPIEAGLLGTFSIDVPIRAIIPVNLEVVVPINQTVDISTTVPLDLDIPVEIPFAETPLIGYLDELDAALARFEDALVRLEGKLTNPLSGGEE